MSIARRPPRIHHARAYYDVAMRCCAALQAASASTKRSCTDNLCCSPQEKVNAKKSNTDGQSRAPAPPQSTVRQARSSAGPESQPRPCEFAPTARRTPVTSCGHRSKMQFILTLTSRDSSSTRRRETASLPRHMSVYPTYREHTMPEHSGQIGCMAQTWFSST